MGDPRKIRRKYSRPSHPWQRNRITSENALVKTYGLKNKTEIWRVKTQQKSAADQAKKLIAALGKQAELEKKQLISRLSRLGLIKQGTGLDDVLSLKVENFLERRLQTIVVRRGLARTLRQARQFISHEQVTVGDKIVSSPSYAVSVEEEGKIGFHPAAPVASAEHVARQQPEKKTRAKE